MKKLMKVAVSTTMVLSLGCQVMAAPSPNGGTIDPGQVVAQVTPRDGSEETESMEGVRVVLRDTEINRENYSEEVLNVIDKVAELTEAVKEAQDTGEEVEPTYVSDILGQVYDLEDEEFELRVYDLDSLHLEEEDGLELIKELRFLTEIVDITFEGIDPTEEKPVEVSFTVNNMTDKMIVYVLNYCDEHGWELLETTRTADNQIKAKFHANASLISFVYLESDEVQLPETGVGTSPATGGLEAETELETEAESGTEVQ